MPYKRGKRMAPPHKTKAATRTKLLTSVNQDKPFRFLDLAPELRNRIYDHALILDPSDSEVVHKKFKEPALLSTCNQIRQEARNIWYSQNDFVIIVHDCDATILQRWLKHMSTLPTTFESSLAIIPKGRYDWKNLLDWCKLIHEEKIGQPFFAEESEDHLKDWIDDNRYDAVISRVTNIAYDCRGMSWQRVWRRLEALRKTELSTSRWSEFNHDPVFNDGRVRRASVFNGGRVRRASRRALESM